MATVSQSPSLKELQQVFGGPGNLRAYARGGGLVPNIPANYGVSDNPAALTLAQFRGATSYVPLSASANGVSSFGSSKGTFTIGTSTCNVVGGNGNVSYSLAFLSGTKFAFSQPAANRATFTATNTVAGDTTTRRGTFRWTVSDGITSATADFDVVWN